MDMASRSSRWKSLNMFADLPRRWTITGDQSNFALIGALALSMATRLGATYRVRNGGDLWCLRLAAMRR